MSMPTKIAVVTPMYKRHDVFELYIKGVNELQRDDVEIIPCISGSEGKISRELVSKIKNSRYVEIENQPLALKTNAALKLGHDCDFFLNIGSDDVIHPDLLNVYIELMKQGYDFIGVTDFYFYNLPTKEALYWGGYIQDYSKGITLGAGRVLSRRFVEYYDWNIFEEKDSRHLDHSMDRKLETYPGLSCLFSVKNHRVWGMDIKSELNMTPFEHWENTQVIDSKLITNKFNYLWK
jgi:hypothetical protein